MDAAQAPIERKSNASVPVDQFDWESFEKDAPYDLDRNTIEESYNQTLSKVVEHEVVEGVVMAVNKREVLVNIGYKSEGVINISEFRYNPDIKPGDKVEVYVETAEEHKQFTIGKLPKDNIWFCDPEGLGTPGYGLCMSAEDMAKIGLLCLNKGIHDGKQIISKVYGNYKGKNIAANKSQAWLN